MDYVQIYFGDEVPAFGCGFLSVLAMGDEGSRQVTLLHISTCDDVTISRDLYAQMARNRNTKAWDIFEPGRDLAARITKNAGIYQRWTPAVRQALIGLGVLSGRYPLGVPADDLPEELRSPVRIGSVISLDGDGPLSDTETPLQGEGSGKLMQRLWMTGRYTPEDLVAIVLKNWPGRKTKVSDVFYNYNLLKKADTKGLPSWPSKK